MCVSADCFAEVSAYEYEGVVNVVTFLVEGLNTEVVLAGPKYPLYSTWIVQSSHQKPYFLFFLCTLFTEDS